MKPWEDYLFYYQNSWKKYRREWNISDTYNILHSIHWICHISSRSNVWSDELINWMYVYQLTYFDEFSCLDIPHLDSAPLTACDAHFSVHGHSPDRVPMFECSLTLACVKVPHWKTKTKYEHHILKSNCLVNFNFAFPYSISKHKYVCLFKTVFF